MIEKVEVMPIEIRELVIRATVQNQLKKSDKQTSQAKDDKSQLVEECVEQVLEILRKERER